MMERLSICCATTTKDMDSLTNKAKELVVATESSSNETNDSLEKDEQGRSNPFTLFSKYISGLGRGLSEEASEQSTMSLADQLELHLALLAFCVKVPSPKNALLTLQI